MLHFLFHLKVRRPRRRDFGLWFPIILIWIFLAALSLVLFPIFLLVALSAAFWSRSLRPFRKLLFFPLIWVVLGNLSGLHIETKSAENDLLFSFR